MEIKDEGHRRRLESCNLVSHLFFLHKPNFNVDLQKVKLEIDFDLKQIGNFFFL